MGQSRPQTLVAAIGAQDNQTMDNQCSDCGGWLARQQQWPLRALLALGLAMTGLVIMVLYFPHGGLPGGLLAFLGAKIGKKTPRTWQCQTCGRTVARTSASG